MEQLADTIQQAQKGDLESVNRLIDGYSSLIYSECERFGLWGMADWSHSDLKQEVLLRLFTKLYLFDSKSDPDNLNARFEAWIRTTIRNHVKNILRDQKALKRKPLNGIANFCEKSQDYLTNNYISRTASSIFIEGEEHEQLNQFIREKLDEPSQRILEMRIVQGCTIQGIADLVGMTFEQVRYNLTKSLSAIEKHLKTASE